MVNNTEILSDNGIIPEEEFSHTILIIKYRKKKKFNIDKLTWFPHCPTEKKTENNKNLNTQLKKF